MFNKQYIPCGVYCEVANIMKYTYLGDRHTDPSLKGMQCDPVLRSDGKCIRSRMGTMVVTDGSEKNIVLARRFRKSLIKMYVMRAIIRFIVFYALIIALTTFGVWASPWMFLDILVILWGACVAAIPIAIINAKEIDDDYMKP